MAGLAVCIILASIALPLVAEAGRLSGVQVSQANLRALHVMHECYAADWSGRQWTAVADDFATYGGTPGSACANYNDENGHPLPGLLLGWGCIDRTCAPACDQGLWGFYFDSCPGNSGVAVPFGFPHGFGSFRLPNSWPLHEYLGDGTTRGRYYDPTYWAPDDVGVYELVEPVLDEPCEFIASSQLGLDFPVWSSYVMSPAAMFDPDVFRAPSQGGWQDPFSFDDGFRSPPVAHVLYPELKSWMIEHHWMRNAPGPCNPFLEGCEPYYFNLGAASRPLTLFYDGSVASLHTAEVVAADAQVLRNSGGDGLWSRDTALGPAGYFGDTSPDGTIVSHHILTTDGIRGRDRLGWVTEVGE